MKTSMSYAEATPPPPVEAGVDVDVAAGDDVVVVGVVVVVVVLPLVAAGVVELDVVVLLEGVAVALTSFTCSVYPAIAAAVAGTAPAGTAEASPLTEAVTTELEFKASLAYSFSAVALITGVLITL